MPTIYVYAHFDLNHSALVAAFKQNEDCLDEVKVWMARNYMCMTDEKHNIFRSCLSLQMQSLAKV